MLSPTRGGQPARYPLGAGDCRNAEPNGGGAWIAGEGWIRGVAENARALNLTQQGAPKD